MNDIQIAARHYADLGWQVIPLDGKKPVNGDWLNLKISPDKIADEFADRNVGVALGSNSDNLVDIDLDSPEVKEIAHRFLGGIGAMVFGRNGEVTHYVFRAAGLSTTKFLDPELGNKGVLAEIRSTGGQTMFPPSVHPDTGKALEWVSNCHPPMLDPAELEQRVRLMCAAALIIRHWPAHQGVGNDVGMALVGSLAREAGDEWTDDHIREFTDWIFECVPNGQERIAEKLWRQAFKRRDGGKTLRTLAYVKAQKLMPEDVVDQIGEWLGCSIGGTKYKDVKDDLYAQHFVVNLSGSVAVMTKAFRPDLKPPRFVYETQSFGQFSNLYRNQTVRVGKKIKKKLGDAFLDDPDRPTYQGTVMSLKEVPGYLNLWQGFAVVPQEGDWSKLKDHIWSNVCNKNEALYEYLMKWMAWKVQNPMELPGVAIVLKGDKGVGKNIWADAFGNLFGQHYYYTSSPELVTGRFNGHMRDVCVMVADEAFWAGDKKHEGELKSLVTSPTRSVEAKGVNAGQMSNHIGLIVLSNEDFVVPATPGERRFGVYEVGGDRKDDHDYFAALVEQLDNGGRQAMLHDLLTLDLSGFQIRRVPNSEGLGRQKLENLTPFQSWLLEVLTTGTLGKVEEWNDANELVTKRVGWPIEGGKVTGRSLRDSYAEYCKETNQRFWTMTAPKFGGELRKWLTSELGDVLAGSAGNHWSPDAQMAVAHTRLPSLDAARAAFEFNLGSSLEWSEEFRDPTARIKPSNRSDTPNQSSFQGLDENDDIPF